MTLRDLAAVLGPTEQTLRLWEKHCRKAMDGSADRLGAPLPQPARSSDGGHHPPQRRPDPLHLAPERRLAVEAHAVEAPRPQ